MNSNENKRNDVILPVIALILDLLPLLSFVFGGIFPMQSIVLLLFICSPIMGLIVGIIGFKQSKQRLSKVLSSVAIFIPVACTIFILALFTGVVTGLIPLM